MAPENKVHEVPDNPEQLRALLDEMRANTGLVGLRLSFGYGKKDPTQVVLFMTHSLGPETEKQALEAAIPTLLRCHEEMMLRVVALHNEGAEAKLRAIGELLAANGCDCDCDHHTEEHDEDCDRCLACKIDHAMGPVRR